MLGLGSTTNKTYKEKTIQRYTQKQQKALTLTLTFQMLSKGGKNAGLNRGKIFIIMIITYNKYTNKENHDKYRRSTVHSSRAHNKTYILQYFHSLFPASPVFCLILYTKSL